MAKENGKPDPIDAHVGFRIRQRRRVLDITQKELAERVGIKFQQIQKYEEGANRVSASRLFKLAAALDVPVEYFFKGLDQNGFSSGIALSERAETLAVQFNALSEERKVAIEELVYALQASQASHSGATDGKRGGSDQNKKI